MLLRVRGTDVVVCCYAYVVLTRAYAATSGGALSVLGSLAVSDSLFSRCHSAGPGLPTPT
eukprot:3797567-Rhodomonas_salina.1